MTVTSMRAGFPLFKQKQAASQSALISSVTSLRAGFPLFKRLHI